MFSIAEKWETILELQSCPINIEFIPEPYYKAQPRPAMILWDKEKDSWTILLYELANKRDVIHELGHIYLAKILNNWYFVDSSKKSKVKNRDLHPEIPLFFNRLIDCFVDYNLSKFDDFYEANVSYIVSGLDQYPDPRQYNLNNSIRYYLKAYIDFHYILKPIDKENHLSLIEANLRAVRNSVIRKKRSEKRKLSFKDFNSLGGLDHQLDKFNSLKNTLDSRKILQYFYDTFFIRLQ